MTRLPGPLRREQLLDTASSLFARRGYVGTTTSQIAKAAGVTEPIIYRHFASKKLMFIALIDRTSESTIRSWEDELARAKDPADRIRRLIGANPMVADKGRGIYRVIVQAMTETEEPDILEALRRHVQRLHDFVEDEIRKAQNDGRISKRFSPQLQAWVLIQLGLGYGMLSAMDVTRHSVDDQGVHVRDLLSALMLGS